jgi:hypothetical protein
MRQQHAGISLPEAYKFGKPERELDDLLIKREQRRNLPEIFRATKNEGR